MHNGRAPVKSTTIKDHPPLKSSSPIIMRLLFLAVFLVAANVALLVEGQLPKITAHYIKLDTNVPSEQTHDYGTCLSIMPEYPVLLDHISLQIPAMCQYFEDNNCAVPIGKPEIAYPGNLKIDQAKKYVKCSILPV